MRRHAALARAERAGVGRGARRPRATGGGSSRSSTERSIGRCRRPDRSAATPACDRGGRAERCLAKPRRARAGRRRLRDSRLQRERVFVNGVRVDVARSARAIGRHSRRHRGVSLLTPTAGARRRPAQSGSSALRSVLRGAPASAAPPAWPCCGDRCEAHVLRSASARVTRIRRSLAAVHVGRGAHNDVSLDRRERLRDAREAPVSRRRLVSWWISDRRTARMSAARVSPESAVSTARRRCASAA